MHEADQPNVVGNLPDADGLTGKDLAEIYFASTEAQAPTLRDDSSRTIVVYGVELGAQYAFQNGFGVQANYTRSESTQSSSFGTHLPIPGVPRNSVMVNSNFVGQLFTFQDLNGNPKTYTIYQAPYGQLDPQVGYDFGEHFGLVLQVVNLTNENSILASMEERAVHLRRQRPAVVLRLQAEAEGRRSE